MTSRERLLTVINGGIPDHVPVAPDTSNMIPAKLTGKPFWDIYLYKEIPIWKAYIDCVKYYGFDSLMDGYVWINLEGIDKIDYETKEAVVLKTDEKIVTRKYKKANGKVFWNNLANIYWYDNPPTMDVTLKGAKVDETPATWEDTEVRNDYPDGEALLKIVKEEMGDHGLVGVTCGQSLLLYDENDIYDYYDDPDKYEQKSKDLLDYYERRFHKLMSLDTKPDFICTGASGTLVYQTPEIFKKLGLPIVKRITELCKQYNIPSHIHSCGPETELVKICYEGTDLTIIDPLEIPPMGDCNLKELKRLYGDKLVLKGNLHTTNVMLFGSVEDVKEASKKAIDDAAEGGRFILSTGDQCGRDTPPENIFAMIETAKTYGKYLC